MISPSTFRDLISGRRRGVAAAAVRLAFGAASVPYGWAIRARNRGYDRGSKETHRPSVPVISVGNLTVGGTGKTPMVEWLARHLREQEVRVAILSRGYGAEQGGLNDEALELELSLPDVPHLQNPDRAASAEIAIDELAAQLLLLDDGFQHRRLERDLDLVLLDATEPFGFDRLLPRGTLREPVTGLRRAQGVVLSRADMIPPAAREQVRARVAQLAPTAAWAEVEHRPAALLDSNGGTSPLETVRDQPVVACCGIGNPAGFRHTLEGLGCRVERWREFPDHHDFTREDVEELAQLAREANARFIVCTRKDLVKLRVPSIGGVPLRAVGVELNFLRGEAELAAVILPLVERARAENNAMFDEDAGDGADGGLGGDG
ncbi:tetraacyldisaccharide 4'-kinase [Lacipirellula parvula]|uniref:Tetraacyldisaccharide 4'-kinase n=1 Tax=Lacipirellula parvula TaxID=2650471 RepID=A0A5K7XK68_9BACT|nr:tetraacyldisaccharide 4'-kinase [Lacipirellula parvula]BBO35521.1 tetraacyldisaccharide 4'-kinase [Lacipirellula parvula]